MRSRGALEEILSVNLKNNILENKIEKLCVQASSLKELKHTQQANTK